MVLLFLLFHGVPLRGFEFGIRWNEGSDDVMMEDDYSLFYVCWLLLYLVWAFCSDFFVGIGVGIDYNTIVSTTIDSRVSDLFYRIGILGFVL